MCGCGEKIEQTISSYLRLHNIGIIEQVKKDRFFFDIHIIGTNKYIECDGDYWHSLSKNKIADKNKEEYCQQNCLSLLRLKENEIKNNLLGVIKRMGEFLCQKD